MVDALEIMLTIYFYKNLNRYWAHNNTDNKLVDQGFLHFVSWQLTIIFTRNEIISIFK